MRRVPFLEKPTAQRVLEYTGIPCYAEVKKIILAECEKNNEILLVGDAAGHPSEPHVMIEFVGKPQNQYDNLKTDKCRHLLFLARYRQNQKCEARQTRSGWILEVD